MSGVGTGIAIAAGVGAAGSIAGAAMSSHAAGEAASTQAKASESAAQLQADEAQKSLDFQKQEWETQQKNLQPWLTGGKESLSNLEALLGIGNGTSSLGPNGSLLTPFTPPTLQQAEQEPGYKFSLDQAEQAIQNSAAAKGDLVSGNTLEALDKYAQNFAENNYTNVYNRAFNTFETNQVNKYNRLAALAGLGQTTATTLGNEGQAAANNVGTIDLTTGAQQGQDIQSAGAATASGYVGSANAWNNGLSGVGNNLMSLFLLNQLNKNFTPPPGT